MIKVKNIGQKIKFGLFSLVVVSGSTFATTEYNLNPQKYTNQVVPAESISQTEWVKPEMLPTTCWGCDAAPMDAPADNTADSNNASGDDASIATPDVDANTNPGDTSSTSQDNANPSSDDDSIK